MSDTRLEYHEIREVFKEFNERMNPEVAAKLADLARDKAKVAYDKGYEDGFAFRLADSPQEND